jgi:hemerythrin-like metal-binding protein
MASFKWQARFDIGVASMNEEHKELLTLMDTLEDLSAQGAPHDQQAAGLSKLGTYTVKHFTDEEGYMKSISFPGLETHKLIHKDLLAKFGVHQKNFEATGKLTPEFFDFLRLWLASHICGIDVKYSEHAKAK